MNNYKEKIISFYEKSKRMPTYSEMMKLFDFKSKNAVYKVITKLVDEGILDKDNSGRLIPKSLFGEIKVLGLVEAGFPSVAEEEVIDTMALDEWLVQKREATYMLRVKGDSMKDAGIFEGDFILAERTENAKVGQIVVAEVDGEWTLKYLREGKRGYYLEPANSNYKNIYPTEDLKVAAVVKSVIRRYGN